MAGADTERLDAVQLKITLTGPEVERVLTEFDLIRDLARRSRVYFCELPSWGRRLALLDAGLILRLRRYDDGRDDATVTLRPCRRERLTARWIGLHKTGEHEFRIEGDWAGQRHLLAASLVTNLPRNGADEALARHGGPTDLFTALQREFVTECADLQPHLNDLRLLGPIDALHWTLDTDDLHVAVVHWTIPDTDVDLLELSVCAPPADASLVQPALTALVRRHGFDPDAFTNTKTRTVLAGLATRHW